jgi:methionyl-tRNA formyltransferase
MSKPILFFGNEKLATGVSTKTPVFKGLIDSGYDLKALIISQKLGKNTDELEIVKVAKAHGIEVKSFSNLRESIDEIAAYGAPAAVLAAYGKIVPQKLLDVFKIGIINIHPSLLPKHRGPTPIESVILNGDTETGVTIMKLASDMDAGPIYKQQAIKLSGNETKQELVDTLSGLGRDMLLDVLDDILDGSLSPTNQPADGATYDGLITKQDGQINWQDNWDNINRKIRAFSLWPRTWFNTGSLNLTIIDAHFEKQTGKPGELVKYNNCPAVYCKDGLVVIDQLIPSGSKSMTGKDFLLGYAQQIS